VHEANLVLLEGAGWLTRALGRRQPVEPFSLEDAIDSIPVQVRQKVREDEGEVVERKAGGAVLGANDGTLLLTRLPGQRVRPR
jgi:hypothetical protein